jgi:hypothetical protein
MGVVMNAVLGVLVGGYFAWNFGGGWGSGGGGGWATRAVVFLLGMTVFWLLAGGSLWLFRRLRGGREGDVARAVERARRSIEEEHDAGAEHAYALIADEAGVRERYGGRERVVPWEEVDGAEVWTCDGVAYAAVRTADGLGVVGRDECGDGVDAFVRTVERRSSAG